MTISKHKHSFIAACSLALTLLVVMLAVGTGLSDKGDSAWTNIDDGLEYGQFAAGPESDDSQPQIDIVRIDPRLYKIVVKMATETEGQNLAAPEWCRQYSLVAATNAGMFREDGRTHAGYLEHEGHVNSDLTARKYLSVAAADPVDSTLPPFHIYDLDSVSLADVREKYRTVIQNLRLIKRPGVNVWPEQDKVWSEAALGEDKDGNILFIFSRSPFSMHDLNEILLSLPIDIVAAQHLEGGPEASLYLSHNGHVIERVGSFETGFFASDGNLRFWPLPNVLGIVKK